jgi:hypothetical protein
MTPDQARVVGAATRVHGAHSLDCVVYDHERAGLPEGWVLAIIGAEKRRPRALQVSPEGAAVAELPASLTLDSERDPYPRSSPTPPAGATTPSGTTP